MSWVEGVLRQPIPYSPPYRPPPVPPPFPYGRSASLGGKVGGLLVGAGGVLGAYGVIRFNSLYIPAPPGTILISTLGNSPVSQYYNRYGPPGRGEGYRGTGGSGTGSPRYYPLEYRYRGEVGYL